VDLVYFGNVFWTGTYRGSGAFDLGGLLDGIRHFLKDYMAKESIEFGKYCLFHGAADAFVAACLI
jgi:hypothetical protein